MAALYSLSSGTCLGIEQGSWFEPDFLPTGFAGDALPAGSTLVAYFAPETQLSEQDFDRLRDLGASDLSRALEKEQDWHAEYRRQAQPLRVGNGFLLDPREPPAGEGPPSHEAHQGRRLLKLPARQAFGSGSHATTQLMVEGMEGVDLEQRTVLDVGTGSGVLSLVARLRGAIRVQALDIELLSAIATRDNAALNGLACPGLFVGKVDALSPAARFDCVLVNVLEDRIASSVPALRRSVAVRGDLLVSGCLACNRERVERLWQSAELEVVSRREKGDWLLLHLKRIGEPCLP